MVSGDQGAFNLEPEAAQEKAFEEFHDGHPDVYKKLLYYARQWRQRRGAESFCGIKALYERARWEMWFESLDDEPPPKLANNHTAYYARLLMERNPDLSGIFRLRRQRVQATIGPGNDTLEPNEHIVYGD
jgi:hypothetical protein